MEDETRSDLAGALRALPEGTRTALLLAANGFSGAEIAAAIGRSDCATRALMCRARLKLRSRLVGGDVRPQPVGLPVRRTGLPVRTLGL